MKISFEYLRVREVQENMFIVHAGYYYCCCVLFIFIWCRQLCVNFLSVRGLMNL